MKAGGTALDWVQALIWPVLILGALWMFRSQLRTLLANLRVKSVKAAGVEIALEHAEQVAEVLKENVQETTEEVAKAEDPSERQRAAEKLQREATALGNVEAWVRRRGLLTLHDTYLAELTRQFARHGASMDPAADKFYRSVFDQFVQDHEAGMSTTETINKLGHPQELVEKWLAADRPTRVERLFD
jgi:hypothetical protein